jgi:hypothetical protein
LHFPPSCWLTWQAQTFDPQEIDKELGWAQSLGVNTMQVFCMIHRREITARLGRAPSPPAFDVYLLDFLNQLQNQIQRRRARAPAPRVI